MFGAIIGDLAGSIYEFEQIKQVKKVKMKNLIETGSFFSDDTILTVAVADAILNGCDYDEKLREYVLKYENYLPNFTPYFKTPFSPNTLKWAKGNEIGDSKGNGAMMRISPVGNLFNTEAEIIENVKLATMPSHNSEEAINCATIVALIIFYARRGFSKQEIIEKLGLKIKEPCIEKFNYTCLETLDVCLYSFFNSNSFDESIRFVVSFGGDTDTNACIVGSMSEAMFGIDEDLKKKALLKLPCEMVKIVEQFESFMVAKR